MLSATAGMNCICQLSEGTAVVSSRAKASSQTPGPKLRYMRIASSKTPPMLRGAVGFTYMSKD